MQIQWEFLSHTFYLQKYSLYCKRNSESDDKMGKYSLSNTVAGEKEGNTVEKLREIYFPSGASHCRAQIQRAFLRTLLTWCMDQSMLNHFYKMQMVSGGLEFEASTCTFEFYYTNHGFAERYCNKYVEVLLGDKVFAR